MVEIDLENLSWDDCEVVDIPMPDGRFEKTIFLYNVRGLPKGVQGFTAYRGNPLFPNYDVIGINHKLTYPPVSDKKKYVKDHETLHKQHPEAAAVLGPAGAEYATRMASDAVYHAKTGEYANTAGDMLGEADYNAYANNCADFN